MANTQINIGGNGTTTLATAGKFCDRNIDVNVNVPASGITPSGTKSITTNGTHDVTNYASANVNVPVPSGYIKPSGTKSITENGTHDVSGYASASVNVPSPAQIAEVVPITISTAIGAGTAADKTILSGNSFVKANYSKEGFFAMLIPLFAASSTFAAKTATFVYQGNRALIKGSATAHGIRAYSNGASSGPGVGYHGSKISQDGYVVALRAKSTGNINVYVAADWTVPAGNYLLVLALAE